MTKPHGICLAGTEAEATEEGQDEAGTHDPEAAKRAAMLSQLVSVDESQPGTLERIIRQASPHSLDVLPRSMELLPIHITCSRFCPSVPAVLWVSGNKLSCLVA